MVPLLHIIDFKLVEQFFIVDSKFLANFFYMKFLQKKKLLFPNNSSDYE